MASSSFSCVGYRSLSWVQLPTEVRHWPASAVGLVLHQDPRNGEARGIGRDDILARRVGMSEHSSRSEPLFEVVEPRPLLLTPLKLDCLPSQVSERSGDGTVLWDKLPIIARQAEEGTHI